MNEPPELSDTPPVHARPPLEEAYRRIARLHYALSTADRLDASLHHRTIDDLADILDILDDVLPPRAAPHSESGATRHRRPTTSSSAPASARRDRTL
jgi:hypothetical protein